MIRRDKTNYNPDRDPGNWTNDMYTFDRKSDRVLEEQQTIINNWKTVTEHGTPEEKAEWELNRRIAAITETDNLASRVQDAIKGHKVASKYDEIVRDGFTRGQTEEEYEEERREYGAFHRKALQRAMKEYE